MRTADLVLEFLSNPFVQKGVLDNGYSINFKAVEKAIHSLDSIDHVKMLQEIGESVPKHLQVYSGVV